MNKIYLFGKVIYKSNLKYEIYPKLKLHIDIQLKTIEGNCFKCVILEDLCDTMMHINIDDYIYVIGQVRTCNDSIEVYVEYLEGQGFN